VIEGGSCRLEPLDVDRHSEDLFTANRLDRENRIWVYLPYGPFFDLESYRQWVRESCLGDDPQFYAVIDRATGKAAGVASYLRIDPNSGSIEVGHINYSPALQRTVAATEAMYLMMKNAFELGYRRYEWKCNALNEPSRRAALRLGMSYEGIFRQMLVVKGRNRDSAWYAAIDSEWPALQHAFETWLSADNFDSEGMQKQSLTALTAAALDHHS
jgi:RimJ/RimL family protein N-acetyltransferase